tara:strand:- start:1575 stop:1826 length:252 start_codon:yes stop_codon:yes gene_type:complete
MGRTVSTWRDRIERRIEYWASFRRVLRLSEKNEFDRVLRSIRDRSSACGMLPTSDVFEPAVLAALVNISLRISKLEEAEEKNG